MLAPFLKQIVFIPMVLPLRGTGERELLSDAGSVQRASRRFLAFLLAGGMAAAACGRTAAPADDVVVEWKVTPAEPLVDGEAVAEVTLRDRARRPVPGATLRIEAHMTHPGMAPVVEPAVEQAQGVYTARLRLTMAGGWILFVKGDLADRRPISRRLGDATARPPR